MLKVENLTKVYKVGTFGSKELTAVNEVSFEINEGEVISLIGESGSGKSTIGKMILKLLPITSGEIHMDEVNIAELKSRDLKEYYRHVQGVFQDPFSSYNPIFKADRIFQLIKDEFFPEMSEEDWKVKLYGALESVGMNPDHVLGKFPHQLSGGQLQRLLIARALLLNVEFLVADEVISMLDASTRIDVLNLLSDLKEQGLAILFITHDLSLGYYISDKVVILYKGTIVETGLVEKVYNNAMHPYTKMLMASVPRLDQKWEAVEIDLSGQQAEIEGGCVYYDRCAKARKDENCCTTRPELIEVEPGHFVACSKL